MKYQIKIVMNAVDTPDWLTAHIEDSLYVAEGEELLHLSYEEIDNDNGVVSNHG
jgi:hypothetical protein